MTFSYISEQIKQRIPLPEAIERYSGERFKKLKIHCPFHNEKTASFKVFPSGKYYCFGCGANGDVIGFVMAYFGIDYREALKKLDGDFNLGLFEPLSYSESRRLEREALERKRKREAESQRAERTEAEYWKAFDKVLELERIIEQSRPPSPDAEPPPDFIKALQSISYARYLLDCAENERSLFKR